MIPQPGQALTDLALRLLGNIAPNTTSTFHAADTALIAQLLLTLGQEFERAAAARMQDISELKDLLRTAPCEAPAKAAREAFLDAEPESLHLSAINVTHDSGMRLLIELHAWAERHDATLNKRIWTLLRAHSERHKFEF